MIETIDSEKLANKVDKAWERVEKPNKLPLNILLQINTSQEEGKAMNEYLIIGQKDKMGELRWK